MIINGLKKIWCIWFTNNPYKIKGFKTLVADEIGQPVDTCESLSAILIEEKGGITLYDTLPKTFDQDIVIRLLNGQKRFAASCIFKEPDRLVFSLTNGCVFGPLGLVYDPQKRAYVNESAQEWTINLKNSVYTNAVHLPPKVKLKGITLSCLTNGADYGFYHFLFESLIKLSVYNSFINEADFILFNGPVTEWKLKWLKRTNVAIDKIIWVNNAGHYECEQLIFTNKLINDQQISAWCINSLKKLLNINVATSTVNSPQNIIWISRKGLNKRELEWEDTILACFPTITKVDLASLDDIDTINVMTGASHIIAPHGAGLSNIYLCETGTNILEIYPDKHAYQPCYKRLSDVCGLNHYIAYLDFKNVNNTSMGLTVCKNILSKFIC